VETYISVDVETAGPIPGEFSLLQIGAVCVQGDFAPFVCLVKPLNDCADPDALRITGLDLDELARDGLEPTQAMSDFAGWIERVTRGNSSPVFVGLNAPFDWSFINYYFVRFFGSNPFGISALDIKSLYMGVSGCQWEDTRSDRLASALGVQGKGDHDARNDAIFQAELFRRIRAIRVN
jgi:DNA polymerase III epsilon subunit-like protein